LLLAPYCSPFLACKPQLTSIRASPLLSALQAPAHAPLFTEVAVQESFGFDVDDLFSEFDAEPVASGSIGQIHRAVLSDTGARLTGMPAGEWFALTVHLG
jgi:predicted unusual protein kinase regulating ubiquinone biosynthesis (AarF/ABC1/UbiB family)